MERETLLMTPGPTMVPVRVLEAMGRQLIHHRTKMFEEVFARLEEDLRFVFQTGNDVVIMASSGTGAMEAAVSNLFSPGEKVLAVSIGSFGDRFADIAQAFGLDVLRLSFPWGTAMETDRILQILEEDREGRIRGVLVTHNETSTGVTNDIESLGKRMAGGDRLLVVDAISSLGGLDLKADEWGIDVVVTGSQKALMAPPGLAFASVSEKALAACERGTSPRFYWDFRKYIKALRKQVSENPPFTPAVSAILGQAEALRMIREEGLSQVFNRHKAMALATQAGVTALGLALFPEQPVSSHIITAVKAPEGLDIEKVRKNMQSRYHVQCAGGQKHLKGQILRIGHCGYMDVDDLIRGFTALECALADEQPDRRLGASLPAVLDTYRKVMNKGAEEI